MINYIVEEKLLDYLNREEQRHFFEENFLTFLERINNMSDESKYTAFSSLMDSVNDSQILNKFYSQIEIQFLTMLDNLPDEDKLFAFLDLLDITEEIGLRKKHFLRILDAINSFSGQIYLFKFYRFPSFFIERFFIKLISSLINVYSYKIADTHSSRE
ncbi:MAG: hypothetical protein ACTSQU_03725 [Promethearchaeota archaeon]